MTQKKRTKYAPRLWIDAVVVLSLLAVVHFAIGLPTAWAKLTDVAVSLYEDLPWVASARPDGERPTEEVLLEEAFEKYRRENNIAYTPNDASSYAFRSLTNKWDLPPICTQLHYVLYEPSLTPEREKNVADAIAEIEEAAGVEFHFDGYTQTTQPPSPAGSHVNRLVIAWVPPDSEHLGGANGMSVLSGVAGMYPSQGGVYLRDTPSGGAGYGTLLHELGHHLGLAHVDDSGQVMYDGGAVQWRPTELSAGDRAGLEALANQC